MATHLLLFAAVAIYASISQAQSVLSVTSTSTPTSRSGPLLTGSCSVSFKTSAVTTVSFSNSFSATVTSSSLVYVSTYFSERATLLYSTLGCLSNQTACCPFPVTALSANSTNPTSTSLASLSPNPTLSSCPPDYSTTYYTPTSTTTSAQAQALCCPSGWGVYDQPLPDTGDTNPCFAAVSPYTPENGQPGNISATGPDGINYIHLLAVFTRSYIVQAGINDGASSGNGGTKKIVEIVVPVVVVVVVLTLCLGIGFRWWKKSQKKKFETQPEIPELGEGLRHEIEGRSLGVTAHKEGDIKASELESNTPLRESKNEKGGVELDSMDIREMGANVPAAHEVEAKDEILSDKSLGRAELI
ncbi:hypothetical protein L207DRAFT_512524 [Hyaloscypha variabilis F]|uniref:Mid2 domain-containing protein n=1 Tax=Hyaloscypha variabilis (strain UAMH 11265 / GT02V1 / F) TaxID=1149755 RepID=A0A2J6RLR2_HYAVF|nr:hypothetical protein L207DRAFT_512524 [Hyaloscypha variabilis F]